MFDKTKRCGLLYEKIRYTQRKNKAINKTRKPGQPKDSDNGNNLDEKQIEDLVLFFDSCVLPRDQQTLSDKLKSSALLRKASNESTRELFDNSFHLYRVNPALVRQTINFCQKNQKSYLSIVYRF